MLHALQMFLKSGAGLFPSVSSCSHMMYGTLLGVHSPIKWMNLCHCLGKTWTFISASAGSRWQVPTPQNLPANQKAEDANCI